MECLTCKSQRITKFIDVFGSNRIFCRNCCVSFPESSDDLVAQRNGIHLNFSAVRGAGYN